MITMKILQEMRGAMLSWPQLDEARVAEALRPNLGVRESHGSAAFPPGFVLPPPGGDELAKENLRYCANKWLPEMSVEDFLGTSYMDDLSNSECFSIARREATESHGDAGVDYDLAPDLSVSDTLLTMRSWIFYNDVANVRDWRWGVATQIRGVGKRPQRSSVQKVLKGGSSRRATR
jgi:hypothetical protein